MSINYLNELISIFLHRDVDELGDKVLSTTIEKQGKFCSAEVIHQVVQSFGSSLFVLQCNKEGIFLVRLQSKINICRDFLAGKCFGKSGGCNQLHLCRFFGHCRKKDCHFPHNLNGKSNQRIVEQWNCQNIHPFLLVPLIQLYNRCSDHSFQNPPSIHSAVPQTTDAASSSVQPKSVQRMFEQIDRTRSEKGSHDEIPNENSHIQSISMLSTKHTTYQIDVSYPSTSSGSHIDTEKIAVFLKSEGFSVQRSFNVKTNGNFHRWTFQFEDNDDADDLLSKSVMPYRDFNLKFKRTNAMIDSTSFILQATIDFNKGPITREKFSSYIDILNNHCSYKLTDLSSALEQILLIQCGKIINFDQLRRVQKSRRQVQGRDVSLKQVYEIDTVIIKSNQASLSSTMIQNIVDSVYENVFIYTITSNQTALIEFIHADALEKWLSNSDILKQKFDINIKPRIKCVDEDDRTTAPHRSSTAQSIRSKGDKRTSLATINLSRQWAMIAGHSKFGIEYRDYIRSETGFEIDIHSNKVQIRCTPITDTFVDERFLSCLNNKTNKYMQRFVFRSILLQQPKKQLTILRVHSPIVAFRRNRRNTYLIATRNSDIEHLMQKLLFKQPLDNNPINDLFDGTSAAQEPTETVDQKRTSTFGLPIPLMDLMVTDDKPTISDKIIIKSMTLPIDTPAQIALFADKTFEKHLQTYFEKTYNIKINIEPTTGNKTRTIMKMVGQEKSVDDGLNELLTLISLFHTKTFDETTDSGWIRIDDAIHVIRHQFNLLNIICVCQQKTSPDSIVIHYIGEEHDKLGISEQYIETLCRKQLVVTTCKPTRPGSNWATFKSIILKRGDYGKDICLFDEQQAITLYGVSHIVKDIQQQFESISKMDEKLNYAPIVVDSDPSKSEKAPIEKPIIRNLSIVKPLISETRVQQPHIQQSPIQQPTIQKPTIQQPSVEKKDAKQPSIQKPTIQQPSVEKKDAKQPSIQQTSVQNLATQQLPIQQPFIQQTSVQKLATQPPPLQQPHIQQSPIQQPPVEKTDAKQPSIQKPIIQQPSIQKPIIQQPSIQKPIIQQPSIQKPIIQQPSVEKTDAKQPSIQQTSVQESGTQQLPIQQPFIQQTSFQKPAIQQPSLGESSIEKLRDLDLNSSLKSSGTATRSGNNDMPIPKLPRRSVMFLVDEPGFEVLVNQDFNQLSTIVNSKCSLQKQIIHGLIQIQIPTAKVFELEDNISSIESQVNASESPSASNEATTEPVGNWFLWLFKAKKPTHQAPKPPKQESSMLHTLSTSTVNNIANVTIDKSKIIVCIGDLTKQAVDLVVVCSTSKILCDAITSAAGSDIQNVYKNQSSYGILSFETSGGNLPCKHIIFRPWIYANTHFQDLKQSMESFVESIMKYAIRQNLSTIAFPSIGCGLLGHDPKIIAEHMLGETYRQIKTSVRSQLVVSFVLLPEQKNVYDAFIDQLNIIRNMDDTPTCISFDKQTVKITLTGSDDNELIQCRNQIKQLARSCSSKRHLTEKNDLADWPQNTIRKYYEYCLQKRVIPTLDIQNSTIDLIGPKEAVSEAENYYFQLTTEILRNARIHMISRGFVWSVEISPGTWERYSYKINEIIEDAQQKNLSYVDFKNEKSERCRVIFANMEEQCQQRKRAVRRKRIDSTLPTTWDLSVGNSKRVVLLNTSKEYKDVVNQFDKTMNGRYVTIVKIERIQNERWYRQYVAHRDEFTQRYKQPDERSLFHGCNNLSADKIVHECFNRSFAGVNGVVYGCGVYFHEHAQYSHNYTRPDISNERTMFLARVLIGKHCIGNSSMKVPPEGYDTTTDGQHIFVVYHDAAAYGEYLIKYL